jgi:hypothetical protein
MKRGPAHEGFEKDLETLIISQAKIRIVPVDRAVGGPKREGEFQFGFEKSAEATR